MNKITKLIATTLLAFPLLVGATVDSCGQQFVYETGGDTSNSRVSIDFSGNTQSISISAPTGYEVIEVFLSVDNDNHTGYWQYASGPVTNFNPNPGTDITSAKVRVRKVCTDVCTNPTATNYDSSVGEFEQANNAVCIFPEPVDLCPEAGIQTTLPCATVPVEPPVCSESQHLESNVCVNNEITPPTPAPTVVTGSSVDHKSGSRPRCGTLFTPSCEIWVAQFNASLNSSSIMGNLINALQKLAGLIN